MSSPRSSPSRPEAAAEPAVLVERENESAEQASVPVPEVVAGRYRILGKIADGGMGSVFRAEHVLSRNKLAIKILHPHLCHGKQAVERFEREVSAAAEISHPGIVQVFDAGVDSDGAFYMAMELLEGESLGARSRSRWPGTRRAVEIMLRLCEPLGAAHRKGFVHRDLKPDNVFIAKDPETGEEKIKLLDFGLVREVGRSGPTMSGITFGTAEYMSPEQAMSAKRAGVPADIWSLGVMLYELLSGVHPFTGETPNAVMANAIKDPHPPLLDVAPHVPPALAAVVEACLEKDPRHRPANADELAALLRTVLEKEELDTRIPTGRGGRVGQDERGIATSRQRTPTTGRWWRPWAIATLSLGIAASTGAYFWSTPGETRVEPTRSIAHHVPLEVDAPAHAGAVIAAPLTIPSEPPPPELPSSTPARSARPRREAPREVQIDSSTLAEARGCLARGDTRCVVQGLQGATGAAELPLLIEAYRMQGRVGDARSTMRDYVRRYPRGSESARYRRELELTGSGL